MSISKISKQIQNFILLGLSLGIASGAIIFLIDKIKTILITDPIHAFLSFLLFLTTFLFLIFWAIFVFRESDFLQQYLKLEEYEIGTSELLAYALPILLGVMFGALFSFVLDIKFYIPIMITIFLVASYGDSIITRILSNNLFDPQHRKDVTDEYENKIRGEIFRYYFQRPYFFRAIITISLLFIGLVLYNISFNIGFIKTLYLSYLFTISSVLYNEYVIWRWRITRRKNIIEIEKNQHETQFKKSNV